MFGERVVSVLTLTAVLCAGVCSPAPPAPPAPLLLPAGDYGVKLCGRQFIRAVIFTCGGSRWRRTFEEVQWRDKSAASSLEDIFYLLGVQAAQEEHHPAAQRRRRRSHISLGVAGFCCSQGCTKNDIGRLC
ncbi:prorelaxin H1 [Nerophis ophidion]|uniref:prorelaxin H1 n=1 Tax=Nerophis ophidion TaxID=159077 RepID=UPI002AE0071F|nr:prorelaxin H1 [Nerophis ophidion]